MDRYLVLLRETCGSPPLQERNKEIVRRFNTAFIQDSDIAAAREILHPDFINHTAPAAGRKIIFLNPENKC